MKRQEILELKPERESEQVEEIPSSLVRWGITIISIISATLIAALCLIQYPHSDGETLLQHLFSM